MQFVSPLISGQLIKRYKRFFADVQLDNGDIVTAHCPNTGAMTGCAETGWQAYLSKHNNPKRKLAYTWELVENSQGHVIGINTANANKLVSEALQNKQVSELSAYTDQRAEVKYGEENSRIDFLLSASNLPDCYVEVKSVTLLQDQQGYFPDAVTTRGLKHLRELAAMVEQGHRAVLFYLVQHSGIQTMSVAEHIDVAYAQQLRLSIQAGVEVVCYGCQLQGENYALNHPCEFIFK
ncbi:DNA/RNA nuclease SfsA [Alteromonadaceae bacterium BrNp21-10]|nr:DNA/RNA nuclease SfsA [Alteromonadaceae bacterium BrNp21-10]